MNRQRRTAIPKNYAESNDLSDNDNADEVKLTQKASKNGIGKMFHRNLDAVIRSPTSADLEQAKKNIKHGIEKLDQIKKDLEQTRERLANLEQQQEAVQRDIDLNRSIVSTLRALPDEVLSIIFEFYIERYTEANPWVLMGVSRQWRAAAIQARRIWSRILLTHAIQGVQNPHGRRRLGYEVCHTVPLLRKALDRAAGAPLHISLDLGPPVPLDVPTDADTISRQLVKTLEDSKAYLGIYELETKNTSIECINRIEFDGFDFPALEMARLTTSSKALNERIKKTSSLLRWLHLEQSPGDTLDWNLSGMTHLICLWLSRGYGSVDSDLETTNMIRSARCLTELKLWHLKLAPLSGDVSLSIPSLLTLELNNTDIECKLDLPKLQTLIVDFSAISNSESPLVLPFLTSLTIKNCEHRGLPHIRATRSLILDISSFSNLAPTLVKIMDCMILPGHFSVHALRLATRYIRPESLSDILAKIPHLEEFEFQGSIGSPKTFFDDMVGHSLTAKTNSSKRDPICTSLKKFKLSISPSVSSANEKAMMRWFETAMKARQKGRYPIKEAFYQDGEVWVPVL
ncbi:hypothetical protein FRC14_008301 [Serendipita sp. 396]|nr:hypothetical protein FRC14_008301 [Serendipita sp. 396]KAG8776130.1 hypothetical protein FRC15_012099 [Serendipita sp. 397]KAG8792514.1 hypothetical protein FRC16_011383 [Serendipita sp. 398]KAG8854741.1 hypothetical protein FRC20_000945 [Serendipita sp. 405]